VVAACAFIARPHGHIRRGRSGRHLFFGLAYRASLRLTYARRLAGRTGGQESSSFLKKRTKKLLQFETRVAATRDSTRKSFLVLFFKKELLAFLPFR
jgi:hypothetical protein